MAEHNLLGKKGEEIAKDYLISSGFSLLESSWRYKKKEIDIIAKDGESLVFVEVKTRTDDYWGNPEEFVTKSKQRFLIEAAEAYIIEKDYCGTSRFDIISIIFRGNIPEIEHISEAFYP